MTDRPTDGITWLTTGVLLRAGLWGGVSRNLPPLPPSSIRHLRFGFGSGLKKKALARILGEVGNCRTEGRPSGALPCGRAVVPEAALVPWLQDCNPIITGLRHLTDYRNSYSAPDTIAWRVVSRALAPRIP